jgi:hypothetical protein
MKVRIIVALFLLPLLTMAQPVKEWVIELPFDSNTYYNHIGSAIDAQGNYIWLANKSVTNGVGQSTLVVETRKVTPAGNILWLNEFDNSGAGNPNMNDVAIDNSGNVYSAGLYWVELSGGGSASFWKVIKVNNDGSAGWEHELNIADIPESKAEKIIVSPGNDIYVGGMYYDSLYHNHRLIIKLNSSGAEVWRKDFETQSSAQDNMLEFDNAGNIIVSTADSVFALSPAGVPLWSNPPMFNDFVYNGPASAVDGQNNVFLLSWISDRYMLGKVNQSGIEWTIDSVLSAFGFGDWNLHLATDNNGNVYAGSVNQTWTTDTPYIYKYDANGNFVWRTLMDYDPNSLIEKNGLLFTNGTLYNADSGTTKAVVEMLDENTGQILWRDEHGVLPKAWYGEGLTTGADALYENVQVQANGSGNTMGLIKYSNINNMKNIEQESGKLKIYPNPASESANIVIGNFDGTEGNLDLFDLQGKLVSRYFVRDQQTVIIPLVDLPVSTYVVKYGSGNEILIKIKP